VNNFDSVLCLISKHLKERDVVERNDF
jgi:hypothetical protein